jgi:hypothetical protein
MTLVLKSCSVLRFKGRVLLGWEKLRGGGEVFLLLLLLLFGLLGGEGNMERVVNVNVNTTDVLDVTTNQNVARKLAKSTFRVSGRCMAFERHIFVSHQANI